MTNKMKKYIVYIIAILVILFFGTSFTISQLYKKQLHAFVMNEANSKLNARCSFQDVSIGFITSFPRINIQVRGIQLIGIGDFNKDTLAQIPELEIQISPLAYLIQRQVKIEKLRIQKADIRLKVLPDGKSNWDIVKADTQHLEQLDTTKLKMAIKYYAIQDAHITYQDQLRGVHTELKEVNHSGKGDFTQDIFSLETITEAKTLTFSYLGKTYLSEVKAALIAPLNMNFNKMEFSFKDNDLRLNELPVHLNAWISMPDTSMNMDITFSAIKSPLKDFLSLVPILYQHSFDDLKAEGNFALNGYIKGKMDGSNLPSFGLGLTIDNGLFKYAKLPTGVDHLALQLNIDNKDGVLDHTVVNLSRFVMHLNNNPIEGNMLLTNMNQNPVIKLSVAGSVDVGELLKIVPQNNMQLSGMIQAKIEVDGTVNGLKQGKGYAKGAISISNLKYSQPSLQQKIQILKSNIVVTPKQLLVNSFEGQYGQTDITANGKLDGYLMYIIKGEPIAGVFKVHSNIVDLNEMMHLLDTASNTQSTTFELPKNIRFNCSADMDKIKYKELVLTEAMGAVQFADQVVTLKGLHFNTLDAAFKLDGDFIKKEKENAKVNLDFQIQHLNVQQAYHHFDVVKKYFPIGEMAQGSLSTQVRFNSNLQSSMSPEMPTLNAEGNIDVVDINLNGSPTVNKISDILKYTQLKNIVIQPVHFSYRISNGQFSIKPFEITTNFAKLKLNGTNGLDQSIHYTMDVNWTNSSPNLNLGQISKLLQPQIIITGKVLSPQIKLGMKALNTEEIVKTRLNKQVDTKLEEAKIRAAEIIQEAVQLSENIRQEAFAKADKLVEETKNPFAQIAIRKLADKIKNEANNKANQIVEAAKIKAQLVIDSAKLTKK